MASLPQPNFSGGEVSPLLYGRTDLSFFSRACKRLKNFFVSQQGAAVSRPGTTYVGEAKTLAEYTAETGLIASVDETFTPVLIPFDAADDESFVLEFGLNYIRVIHNGGYLETFPGSGVKYQVPGGTPYKTADLSKLHYAQVGEVLTLVTPAWDAYELRHVSDFPTPQWTFTQAITAPLTLDGITVAFVDPGTTAPTTPFGMLIPLAWQVTHAYALRSFVINDNGKVYECIQAGVSAGAGGPAGTVASVADGTCLWKYRFVANVPDSTHAAREWKWKVTAMCRLVATGELFETLAMTITQAYHHANDDGWVIPIPIPSDVVPVFFDMPIAFVRGDTAGLLPGVSADFTVEAYNFYRGRGNLFGFIGSTTAQEFVDVGDAPNYSAQPPVGTDPFREFNIASTAGAPFNVIHADRPAAVAYFESRRMFAGLTRREQDVLGSATSDFDNYDQRKLFHIAGESLVFTVAARRRGRIRHLMPMDRLVVLTASASFSGGGQVGSSLDFDSVDFRHIEEVGANDVTPLIVDGVCLFVRNKGRGVRGLVSGGQDNAFRGVELTTYAEHLMRGVDKDIVSWTYAESPWDVVWAVRGDGVLLSCTFGRDPLMMAWATHEFDGKVKGVCAVSESDEDAVYLVIERTINGVPHRYIERMTSRHERGGAVLTMTDGISTPPDYICVDCAVSYVGAAATTFTGLNHLEGKQVYVVAQGQQVIGPETVTGGSITVDAEIPVNVTGAAAAPAGDRLLVYIGLLYQPLLEPLDVRGASTPEKKRVTHVGFRVDNSKGVLVGADEDHLDSQPTREVSEDFGTTALRTEVLFTMIRSSSDLGARVVLKQSQPLPVTVVAICRRLVAGDG